MYLNRILPLRYWSAVSVVLYIYFSLVNGTSYTSDEDIITHYEFVSSAHIEVIPSYDYKFQQLHRRQAPLRNHSLQTTDSFRLTLNAYNKTFFLHLEPHDGFIHQDAEIVIWDDNGKKRTEKLNPLVFKGTVVDEEFTGTKFSWDQVGMVGFHGEDEFDTSEGVVGEASIFVHQQGSSHDNPFTKHNPIVQGVFTHKGETYNVKPINVYRRSKRSEDISIFSHSSRRPEHQDATMIVYKESDRRGALVKREVKAKGCGSEDLGYNKLFLDTIGKNGDLDRVHEPLPVLFEGKSTARNLRKRQVSANEPCIRSPKFVYMGVAGDCTYVQLHGSPSAAVNQLIANWARASAIYQRIFNIGLGILKVDIRPVCDDVKWNKRCSDNYNINDRLSDFTEWRGTLGDDGTGLWHLLTQCFTGFTVGVAWLGTLCESKAIAQQTPGRGVEFVGGTGVSSAFKEEWKVVAHEIGHNFGAIHDCTAGSCPPQFNSCCQCESQCDCQSQFLMSPTNDVKSENFSPCTISMICRTLQQTNARTCLLDPGSKPTIQGNVCGNGVREGDEQCDCGQDCARDPCCDQQCKFKNGAVCSDRNQLCCNQCQFKPANTVCRAKISDCDIDEICSGNNGDCPKDVFVPDGSDCKPQGGTNSTERTYCASGICTNRDLQCQARSTRSIAAKACPQTLNTCNLICDTGAENVCANLNGNFVDGTECGVRGRCSSGACTTNNAGDAIIQWISDNKYYVIAMAIFAFSILCCCCTRILSRYRRKQPSALPESRETWVDPLVYNGFGDEYSNPTAAGVPNMSQVSGQNGAMAPSSLNAPPAVYLPPNEFVGLSAEEAEAARREEEEVQRAIALSLQNAEPAAVVSPEQPSQSRPTQILRNLSSRVKQIAVPVSATVKSVSKNFASSLSRPRKRTRTKTSKPNVSDLDETRVEEVNAEMQTVKEEEVVTNQNERQISGEENNDGIPESMSESTLNDLHQN